MNVAPPLYRVGIVSDKNIISPIDDKLQWGAIYFAIEAQVHSTLIK